MKGEEKQVKQAVELIGQGFDKNSVEYQKLLEKAKAGAYSPKDLLRVSDAQMESIYAQAYRLYNTGKYKEASDLFRSLIMTNSAETKYSLGLAACFHMMKDFEAAAQIYLFCNALDEKSPIPAFHASDCYLQLKDRPSALVSLTLAIEKAGDRPEYKILKDRAMLTAKALKKELKITDADEEKLKKEASNLLKTE